MDIRKNPGIFGKNPGIFVKNSGNNWKKFGNIWGKIREYLENFAKEVNIFLTNILIFQQVNGIKRQKSKDGQKLDQVAFLEYS